MRWITGIIHPRVPVFYRENEGIFAMTGADDTGEERQTITILLFTNNPESGCIPSREPGVSCPVPVHVILRHPVPETVGRIDRQAAEAVVVLSEGDAREGLPLLRTLRGSGDSIPFLLAAVRGDPLVAHEALLQGGDYRILPGATGYCWEDLCLLATAAVETRRAHESLAMLNRKLALVGSVTRHDVLNQLTAITGYTELLGMMIQDEKLLSYLGKSRSAIDKIRRQFQFAKDYQNIGVGAPRWQMVARVVSRMNDDFDLADVNVLVTTGATTLYADPLFEKVIYNLFDNALRHGGKVTRIAVSFHEDPEGGVLTVEDDGVGIPAGEKEKIFERGYGKNTGWGLFLVREILAITGMTIAETGTPGKGARFEIRIPPGTYASGGIEPETPA